MVYSLESQEEMSGGADISECGTYRYTLRRHWDAKLPVAVFAMLNPSVADAKDDDPTVRKCIGFSRRLGCGSTLIVNMFCYRTPYPSSLAAALRRGEDIVGPDGDKVLANIVYRAADQGFPLIVAWGSAAGLPKDLRIKVAERARGLAMMARSAPVVPLVCLGTAKDGNPRHPLMLAYATELEPWTC